jgi:hypothetical protein
MYYNLRGQSATDRRHVYIHPRFSFNCSSMAPAWQDNTRFRTDMAELHQRSSFFPRSFREHRPEMGVVQLTRRTRPRYRQLLAPGVELHLRRADLHPVVAVIETETKTETTSSVKMTEVPPGSVTLHANIIPPASSLTTTTTNPLHQTDSSNTQIALIIAGALLGVIMGFGIILVVRSSWNWKGRAQFKGLKCCYRHKSTLRKEASVLCKETSFVGADFSNPTWGTITRAVHIEDLEDSNNSIRIPCSVNQSFYSAPSNIPTVSEQSADIPPGQPVFEADCKRDDFQGRLQVEEEDIALALIIALRDLSSSGWDMGAAPTDQSLLSAEDLPNDASFEADIIHQVDNGHSILGFKNRSRQGSDASATSQETTTDVMECFSSASSSRSSMTSSASIETSFDQEGPEMPYEIKRAQTRSVEVKKGILVAWQGSNATTTATISDISPAALALLSPLTLDNSCGVISSGSLESFSLTSGECHPSPTISSLVRQSSLETMDSRGTSTSSTESIHEGDYNACFYPVPYLVVTCPSTSTIFTFSSIGSVDLSDFPYPPTV